MKTTIDTPVKVQLSCNLESIHDNDQKSNEIENVEIAFKSDFMENYENGTVFSSKKKLKSIHYKGQLYNFSIGTDGELYVIEKDSKGKNYWNHKKVCPQLLHQFQTEKKMAAPEVLSFNVIASADTLTKREQLIAVCCLGDQQDKKNHAIFVTTALDIENLENTSWTSLGNVMELQVESMHVAHFKNDSKNELSHLKLVCNGRKNSAGNLHSYYYHHNDELWKEVNFEIFDEIKDVQFGKNPIEGLVAYAVGSYRGNLKFSIAPFDEKLQTFSQTQTTEIASTYFKNPVAFILDTITDENHDYYGFSEVYMVEKTDRGTNQIKYLSAKAQDYNLQNHSENVITVSGEFDGKAEKIFFNKNTEGRIDLYAHVTQHGTGQLLHTFHPTGNLEEIKRWCPIYTLEKNVGIVSPASNATGRICEVFMAATDATDLRYIWQDDKLYAWNRENVYVEALDHAIPVNSVQTKITFYDADSKDVILFPAFKESFINITPLQAVTLEINHKKYILEKKETIKISTKKLMGEVMMNINVTEADAPYFEMTADFIPNEKIVIHPVEKIQNTIGKLKAEQLKNPKDRYGNEVKNLVSEEKEKYIDEIVKGVNEIAGIRPEKLLQNVNSAYTTEEKKQLDREGIWVLPKNETFDTLINLEQTENIPDGPLFAFDFSGEIPKFLDRQACISNQIGTDLPKVEYAGFWDDLAKNVGAFFEAIKNTVEKVTAFVAQKVGDVIQFTINIAGKIITCVVKFAEQTMKLFLVVLEKFLEIALEKMLAWLGFVFDVKYIRAIQKEMASYATQSLSILKKEVKNAKTHIEVFMKDFKRSLKDGAILVKISDELQRKELIEILQKSQTKALQNFCKTYGIQLMDDLQINMLEADKKWHVKDAQHEFIIYNDNTTVEIRVKITLSKLIQTETPKSYTNTIQQKAEKNYREGDKENAKQLKESMQNDPTIHWVMTTLKAVPAIGIPSKGYENIISMNIDQEIKNTVINFIKTTVEPLAAEENENKTLQQKIKEFVKFLDKKPSLGEIFLYISEHLIALGVEIIDAIVQGILNAIESLATLFENILTAEIKIPVLKKLFAKIMGDDSVPFNLLNAVSLLLAVPASIFCKMIGVKAPESDYLVKDPEWWFYVKTYGGLTMDFFNDVVTLGSLTYNWIQKADPSGESGKLGAIIFSAFGTLFFNPLKILLDCPMINAEKPTANLAKKLFDLNITQWALSAIKGVMSVGNFVIGVFVPNLASEAYDIVRSLFEGVIDLVLQTVELIYKVMIFADEKEILKLIDSIIGYLRNMGSIFADVCASCGNILPSSELVSAIIKSIFHGLSIQTGKTNQVLAVSQVVIQTIDYNRSETVI